MDALLRHIDFRTAEGFNSFCADYHNTEITDLGIKYIQNGGYKRERSNRSIDEELKKENLKNAKRSWIALTISIIPLAIAVVNRDIQ